MGRRKKPKRVPTPRDRERWRERYERGYAEVKRLAAEVLGDVCAVCGAKDVPLQIDHVDPIGKRFRVTHKWWVPREVLLDELEQCQHICDPCHIEKSKIDRKKRKEYVWETVPF